MRGGSSGMRAVVVLVMSRVLSIGASPMETTQRAGRDIEQELGHRGVHGGPGSALSRRDDLRRSRPPLRAALRCRRCRWWAPSPSGGAGCRGLEAPSRGSGRPPPAAGGTRTPGRRRTRAAVRSRTFRPFLAVPAASDGKRRGWWRWIHGGSRGSTRRGRRRAARQTRRRGDLQRRRRAAVRRGHRRRRDPGPAGRDRRRRSHSSGRTVPTPGCCGCPPSGRPRTSRTPCSRARALAAEALERIAVPGEVLEVVAMADEDSMVWRAEP